MASLQLRKSSSTGAYRILSLLEVSTSSLLERREVGRSALMPCSTFGPSFLRGLGTWEHRSRARLESIFSGTTLAAGTESILRSRNGGICRYLRGSVAICVVGGPSGRRRTVSTRSQASQPAMKVSRLDHIVLTVKDIEATCQFYSQVLGMEVVTFGAAARVALAFGEQKINLHPAGNEFEPKAQVATPGSADLCFITDEPLDGMLKHVQGLGVTVIQGPVARSGATGAILSIYFRDPDMNLIEVANYV